MDEEQCNFEMEGNKERVVSCVGLCDWSAPEWHITTVVSGIISAVVLVLLHGAG